MDLVGVIRYFSKGVLGLKLLDFVKNSDSLHPKQIKKIRFLLNFNLFQKVPHVIAVGEQF